jgi:hypothetical protein
MKFNKILLIIAFAAISQSVFAAKVLVYNGTGKKITVVMQTTEKPLRQDIENGQKLLFDSNFSAFTSINWFDVDNAYVTYSSETPSAPTMLTGAISLYKDGQLALNFDKNGASSSKTTMKNATIRNRS